MGPIVVVPGFHQHLFDHLRFDLHHCHHVFRFCFRLHRALAQMTLDYVGSLADLGAAHQKVNLGLARGQMAYVRGFVQRAHDYLLEEFQLLE